MKRMHGSDLHLVSYATLTPTRSLQTSIYTYASKFATSKLVSASKLLLHGSRFQAHRPLMLLQPICMVMEMTFKIRIGTYDGDDDDDPDYDYLPAHALNGTAMNTTFPTMTTLQAPAACTEWDGDDYEDYPDYDFAPAA